MWRMSSAQALIFIAAVTVAVALLLSNEPRPDCKGGGGEDGGEDD
jgi:hypothetical protein